MDLPGPPSPHGHPAVAPARLALRLGLGFIWIYEGLVPKLILPITEFERAVVAASGLVPNDFVAPFIQMLGFAEILLGILVLFGIGARQLCVVQGTVICLFTGLIPLTTSAEILAHPFGLLTKNIPILGAIVALWFLSAPAQPGARSAA